MLLTFSRALSRYHPIYPDSEAAADNADLQRMGLKVTPVIFSRDKDFLISRVRWRALNLHQALTYFNKRLNSVRAFIR